MSRCQGMAAHVAPPVAEAIMKLPKGFLADLVVQLAREASSSGGAGFNIDGSYLLTWIGPAARRVATQRDIALVPKPPQNGRHADHLWRVAARCRELESEATRG